ncbi:MAG: amidohydrolase family protein, partial [Actinomycetota bacterium]
VGAEEVLLAGTVRGGEVLGLPVGRIAPDYAADLVVVDLKDLSLQPTATAHKQIVYSMRPDAIRRVLVGGEPVVEGGKLVNVDEEEIRSRVGALTRGWAPVERVTSPV